MQAESQNFAPSVPTGEAETDLFLMGTGSRPLPNRDRAPGALSGFGPARNRPRTRCGSRRRRAPHRVGEEARAPALRAARVWSGMFDPFHNAVKDYYLVRDDLTGSWEG